MKYMFASDIHGSAYYCKKMLEAYDKEKADRLLGALSYTISMECFKTCECHEIWTWIPLRLSWSVGSSRFGGLDTFTHISSYLMKDLCDSKEATKERDEKFLRVYQALYGSKQNHRIKKSADWNGEFPVLFCDSQH